MQTLMNLYERLVLDRPRLSLVLIVAVVGFFAMFASDFRLDASADSLLLDKLPAGASSSTLLGFIFQITNC